MATYGMKTETGPALAFMEITDLYHEIVYEKWLVTTKGCARTAM